MIRVERDSFLGALSLACAVASDHTTKPIYACAKIATTDSGTATVTANNGEQAVSAPFAMLAGGAFAAVVNATKLKAAVSLLSDAEISLELVDDGRRLALAGADTRYTFYTLPADDFPATVIPSDAAELVIGCAALVRAFSGGGYAEAQELSRYAINGVKLSATKQGRLRVESTDGRRLGRCEADCTERPAAKVSALIPANAVKLVARVLSGKVGAEVKITLGESGTAFSVDGATVVTVNLEGNFPDTDGVIPAGTGTLVEIDSAAILSAVKQASVFTSDEARAVVAHAGGGHVTITANGPEVGDAKIECEAVVTGPELDVGFNPAYLRAAIQAAGCDQLTLDLGTGMRPVVIRTDDSMHLVMPVSV
jgi:DNA polymerase III subunit beta